jgi:hypothetical protein
VQAWSRGMGTCDYFTTERYERNGNNVDFQTYQVDEKNALKLLNSSLGLSKALAKFWLREPSTPITPVEMIIISVLKFMESYYYYFQKIIVQVNDSFRACELSHLMSVALFPN